MSLLFKNWGRSTSAQSVHSRTFSLSITGPLKKIKEERVAQGKKRANYLFQSLKVAYEAAPLETGLVFVHLDKSTGVHPVVTLFDKAGTKYEVALDSHEFLLQQKAGTSSQHFPA